MLGRQSDKTLAIGSVIKGRYEIQGTLGQGGFGVVYEGIQKPIGRPVAIKVLKSHDPDHHTRFLREAQVAARLAHPSVVTIHDFGTLDDGRPFIVMEKLAGHSLAEVLSTGGAMAPDQALPLMCDCLEALAEAHEAGIVHKDLKPSNLFVVRSGRRQTMRILDFGIARLVDAPIRAETPGEIKPFDLRLTRTGDLIGTPQYLPPEYYQQQTVTPALDVYQMGLVLVEMLTGKPVIEVSGLIQCMYLVALGSLPVPEGLLETPLLGPVLRHALERDHTRRYRDAAALLEALEALDPKAIILPDSGPDTRPLRPEVVAPPGPPPRPSQRIWHYDGPAGHDTVRHDALIDSIAGDPEGSHLVWSEGFEDWRHWRQVPLLVHLVELRQGEAREVHRNTASVQRAVRNKPSQELSPEVMLKLGNDALEAGTQQLPKALHWFKRAATQGLAEAQYRLGKLFQNGQGVPQDDIEAARWLSAAAEQGHGSAQQLLGWLHYLGRGVEQNDAEAARWFRAAAEQGHAESQANLGWLHLHGRGVAQSDAKAIHWTRQAAQKGAPEVVYTLGWMLRQGRGAPADLPQAARLFEQAARQGHAEAAHQLGWLYQKGLGVTLDLTQALGWFRIAAEQGSAESLYSLGWALQKGLGAEPDLKGAIACYRRAAIQGHAWSINTLSWLEATHPDPHMRHGQSAVERMTLLLQTEDRSALYLDTLAAAMAEVGRFEEARALQREAINTWIPIPGADASDKAYRERLVVYEKDEAWREAP